MNLLCKIGLCTSVFSFLAFEFQADADFGINVVHIPFVDLADLFDQTVFIDHFDLFA